jgi:hypothetical protein
MAFTPTLSRTGEGDVARRQLRPTVNSRTYNPMPSERAKENKQLVATCAGCGTSMSTELLSGVVVGTGRQRRIVPVCATCREKGWVPDGQSV